MLGRLAGPGGALALIRVAAIPVFFLAERLVDHPAGLSGPFAELLLVAGLYALATLVGEALGRPLAPRPVLATADLGLITALVATSGGPFSELRYAFFFLPFGAALLLSPVWTAAASAACVGAYLGVVVLWPDDEAVRPDALEFEVTQAMFLAWLGGAATLLSRLLARQQRELADLARSRGQLVAEALAAEDRARRRLAEALHDEALQNLLAARQLLEAGDGAGDLVREGLDESVRQIREAVFDLHPYLLEQSGLRAALQAVAEHAARRAGFTAAVEVDPGVEGTHHDPLLFSIGRELLANAARHAGAETVRVRVRDAGEAIELEVLDDGRGVDPAMLAAARADGHIGLASCAERARAVGGAFTVGPGPEGRGTAAAVRIPRSAALRPQGADR
jgi:two-component system, NarL family, sensor kinase